MDEKQTSAYNVLLNRVWMSLLAGIWKIVSRGKAINITLAMGPPIYICVELKEPIRAIEAEVIL